MRFKRSSFSLLVLLLVAGLIYQTSFVTFAQRALIKPPPPKTRVDNVTETLHGVTIADPYRWLEDQDSPETRAWIDEQNRYTQSVIGSLPGHDPRSRAGSLRRPRQLGAGIPSERRQRAVGASRDSDDRPGPGRRRRRRLERPLLSYRDRGLRLVLDVCR